jgi:uncharacterized protein (TIGR00251 family)
VSSYDSAVADSTVLVVRVTPRAGRDEIAGWQGDELRVRLRAPPVDGRANEALVRLLASSLAVPRSSIELVTGATARVKRLRIEGLSAAELRQRLS